MRQTTFNIHEKGCDQFKNDEIHNFNHFKLDNCSNKAGILSTYNSLEY